MNIHHFYGNEVRKILVLITYDVNTETSEGRKRLRQLSKACLDYGQRVQNSVFECEVESEQFLKIKERLVHLIDTQSDSLRFYMLGNANRKRVEHFGVKPSIDMTEPLII